MKFDEVKDLMKLFEESKIHKFEFKITNNDSDFELKLEKESAQYEGIQQVQPVLTGAPVQTFTANDVAAVTTAQVIEGNVVTAPLVGTYYNSPSPDKNPYIKVGDKVTKGQTICIIEAMKVMNEITATHDGIVTEVLVSNQQMVEFGQPLVVIK